MRRPGASAGAASGLAVQIAMAMTLAVTLTLAWPFPCSATDAPAVAANPALEARMMALAAELRCLVCQNQSLADSHAGLAEDLRQQIREMLAKGQSERQVLDYMADRYGDFVLYRPPLKAATALLWGAPVLLMAGAVGGLFIVLRRRQRLGAEAFDPDTPDEEPPR
jgi:cytochrome c-type biogenesis protein CcmH